MIDNNNVQPASGLNQPLTLPCGLVLKNRIIKPAMSDSLGDGKGNPTAAQIRLYERWAQGGTALSIIGEVQIDARFAEKPGNLVLDETADIVSLTQLAQKAAINGAHIWVQLGHAGALAHPPISHAAGPSAINLAELQCAQMSATEIGKLAQKYADAALIAKQCGFSGVQIHAAHGFLLSQFLSPLFNQRTDQYGGSINDRSKVIVDIITAMRLAVGSSFAIGIKINATDMLEGGFSERDALTLIEILDSSSLDLIDISGGTYFPGAKSSSDGHSAGPYFSDFAKKAKSKTNIPIMLTGGFKTSTQAINALTASAADVIGVARGMVVEPAIANHWLQRTSLEESFTEILFPRFESPAPGAITAWYSMRLSAIASDNDTDFLLTLSDALIAYEERDNQRGITWLEKYPLKDV